MLGSRIDTCIHNMITVIRNVALFRPRTTGRARSKTDISSYQSKENLSYVANVPREGLPSPRDSVSTTSRDDRSYSSETSPNSSYSAYDEYNERPAGSGVPRVRPRRGSEVQTPSPESFPHVVVPRDEGRRGRSQSLFIGAPPPRWVLIAVFQSSISNISSSLLQSQ